jgi:hypothetical protein
MKTLKIIGMLVLLISFTACKKDKVEPEVVEEPFDITQYVMVEKHKASSRTDAQPMHFIVTFEPQGKSVQYSTFLGAYTGTTYTYNEGVLKTFVGGVLSGEWKIVDKTITPMFTVSPSYTCQLVKIPAGNQFNGNTYSGSWKPQGSLVFYYANLKFTDTHYAEASLNVPVPDKEYTLIKNVVAYYSTANTRTLLVLIGDKLEGSRFNFDGSESVGAFTKR